MNYKTFICGFLRQPLEELLDLLGWILRPFLYKNIRHLDLDFYGDISITIRPLDVVSKNYIFTLNP